MNRWEMPENMMKWMRLLLQVLCRREMPRELQSGFKEGWGEICFLSR